MAARTYVTFTLRDSFGRIEHKRYEARSSAVTDGVVQGLAADLQALTGLGIEKATVSRAVDISGQADAIEAGSNKQADMSLVAVKSLLRNSGGGQYTFNLPEPKDAFLTSTAAVDVSDAAWNSFLENFDDGDGVAATVGDFYISDGEEIVEGAGGSSIVDAFLNKD